MPFGVRTFRSVLGLLVIALWAGTSAAQVPLRVELPSSFGVALPRAWCSDCGGARYGRVVGLGAFYRPWQFAAAGVVFDTVSFPTREYDLVRLGAALRFYAPDQGVADPYLQLAVGKTWARADARTSGEGYGPWVSLTAGLDLSVATWLKTGASIGYHWSDDPAPQDVPFSSAGQRDGSPSGRVGVVVLMGLKASLELGHRE